MSASTPNAFLNIDDAHLRVTSGNVYAQGLNISGISFSGVSGLQTVTNTGNVTTNTLEFKNGEKAFVATSNVDVKGSLDVANVATIYNGSNADYDQKQKFTSTVSASGNYFSNTLAVSTNGLYAIVGAHGEDKAYTFTRSGSTWTQENIFSSTAGSAFGYAVDISSDGTYAIVSGNGSASVFYRSSGSTWDSGTTLTAGGISVTTGYGASVSISDDGSYAIVGATGQNAAYIFRRTGTTTWDAGVKIALTGFTLGFSVAISGDGLYALLGAHAQHTAYVFKRTGAYIWSQQVKITESDSFGYSVALSTDGSRALIGATGGNGKAYSYERSGSDWSQNAIITASDAISGDAFGSAVSLSSDGSYALVGAPGNEKAYTFKNAGTVWTELGIETASDATAGHVFGRSVSISGDGIYALVGASGNEAAYSYERKETLVLDVRGEANVRTLNVSDDLIVTNNILASNNLTVAGNLNVTTIRSDSNVVAEYTGPHDRPLRKYPEVALTSASDSGYVTSSSTTVGTYYTWKAFDNNLADDSSVWTTVDNIYDSNDNYAYNSDKSLGEVDGEWLKIELPNKIKPSYVRIYPRTYVPPIGNNQSPEDFKILASNDDTNWVELVSVVGWVTNATWGKWDISSNTPYKYFAIVCTRTIGAATFGLAELEYYGYEEGSGSLDTTLKTVYNVPATTGTQLEVYYDAKGESTVQSPIPDLSPNTNTGAVSGHSPTLDSTDGIDSFKFNGSSQYIDAGNIGVTAGSGEYPHSMSAWIKIDTLNSTMALTQIGSDPVSAGNTIIFYINTLGNIILDISGGSNTEWYSGLLTNQWYHVSYTYNGGASGGTPTSYKLYINGVDQGHQDTGAGSGTLNLASGSTLAIGHRFAGNFFDGSVANFRHYSKILNADQVKELYDYQKDYFLGSKSQLTLYKGHLGVGVTEPSGQLELAGDERIQEYPPGPMDDYDTNIPGHGVFKAYASTDYEQTPYRSWNAFDKTITTVGGNNGWASKDGTWLSDGTTTPVSSLAANFDGVECHWLALQLPYEVKPTLVTLQTRNDGKVPGEVPAKGRIYGSKDGVTWNQIRSYDIRTEVGTLQASTDNAPVPITLTTNEYYTHLLLTVDERYGGSGLASWTAIGELRYFGTPGPTTLDKGSLTLGRSLDVPRVSRYDVDTETPRPEKLVVDFDTTVNSSPTDISGNGNHGTFSDASGVPTYSAADKAFDFDGVSGAIWSGPLSPAMTGDKICSMSAWFKTTDASASQQTIMWLGQYQSNNLLLVGINNGTLRISLGSGCSLDVAGVIESNTWYHVVGIKQGTGSITSSNFSSVFKLYLNGEPMTGTFGGTARTLSINTNYWYVGAGTSTGNEPFPGYISNPKLYDTILEPSEVRKLYNLGRTGRSMVISDTAVGIGRAPEAQLDVRGDIKTSGMVNNAGMGWFITGSGGNAVYTTGENWFSSSANSGTESSVYATVQKTRNGADSAAWNATTGFFTAPEDGMYSIDMVMFINGFDGDRWGSFELQDSNSNQVENTYTFYTANITVDDVRSYSKTVYMKKDWKFRFYSAAGTVTLYLAAVHSSLNINKIS